MNRRETLAIDVPRDATTTERASLKAYVDSLVSQRIGLEHVPELALQALLEQRRARSHVPGAQSESDESDCNQSVVSSEEDEERPPVETTGGDAQPLLDRRPRRKRAKKTVPLPPLYNASRHIGDGSA